MCQVVVMNSICKKSKTYITHQNNIYKVGPKTSYT